MPVRLEIIEDGYVLHYTISDPWEISDLLKAYDQERAYRDSVALVVHSLNELSGVQKVPPSWWIARQGPGLTHPRSGEMVFVGLAPGVRVLVDTVLKATRYQRIKTFNTADEAQEYIHRLVAESKSQNATDTP